jgi:hypothetical protein
VSRVNSQRDEAVLMRSAEASELTLEDRITERLKTYQRQLSKLAEEKEKDTSV